MNPIDEEIQETVEEAFKRGQQNMIELTAAALDMAGLPVKAQLWRDMMAPFPYTPPKKKG